MLDEDDEDDEVGDRFTIDTEELRLCIAVWDSAGEHAGVCCTIGDLSPIV